MSNQWFRMYHEFATDPKVQMLSETDQRRYIMLLCIKCSNDDVTLQHEEVAFQLRISNEELTATKQRLVDKGLIDEVFQPIAWDKRQFKSDSSAERVARHRANKKKPCNVTVTPPDTDTDTDTDKKKTKAKKSKTPIPDFIDKILWSEWMGVRTKKKAVNSATAIKSLVTNLTEIQASGRDPNEAIKIAITKSWKSVELEWLKNLETNHAENVSSNTTAVNRSKAATIHDRNKERYQAAIAREQGDRVDNSAECEVRPQVQLAH